MKNQVKFLTRFAGLLTFCDIILYYCTYYSVSLTCTVHCVHCTIDIYTLYVLHMFPVSLFPMLRFHLQHLFTLLFTLLSIHLYI